MGEARRRKNLGITHTPQDNYSQSELGITLFGISRDIMNNLLAKKINYFLQAQDQNCCFLDIVPEGKCKTMFDKKDFSEFSSFFDENSEQINQVLFESKKLFIHRVSDSLTLRFYNVDLALVAKIKVKRNNIEERETIILLDGFEKM